VLVGKETVGINVTEPESVGLGPGEAVHVGGSPCAAKGSAGPSGCSATERYNWYVYTPSAAARTTATNERITMVVF